MFQSLIWNSSLNTSGFQSGIAQMITGMRSAETAGGGMHGALTKVAGIAFTGLVAGIAAVTAAIGASVMAAATWEKELARVAKTALGEQTPAAMKQLSTDLRNEISNLRGVSEEEYMKAAGIAGSMGFQGKEAAQAGTLGAKAGAAFEMAPEQAMRMLGVITQTYKAETEAVGGSLKMMEKAGSAVNVLGNKFASTESNILQFLSEFGGTASMRGESISRTAAMGSLMQVLGFDASNANTLLQTSVQQGLFSKNTPSMELAEQYGLEIGKTGTPKTVYGYEVAAKIMGTTGQEIKSMLDKDLYGTLIDIVTKIKNSGLSESAQQEAAMAVFGGYGSRGILKLADTRSQYEEMAGVGEQGFTEGTSMQKEYETQTRNLIDAFGQLMQNARILMAVIGELFTPAITSQVENFTNVIKSAWQWIEQLKNEGKGAGEILSEVFKVGLSKIPEAIGKIFESGKTAIPIVGFIDTVKRMLTDVDFSTSIKEKFNQLLNDIKSVINGLISGVPAQLNGLSASIIKAFSDLDASSMAKNLMNTIVGAIESLADTSYSIASAIYTMFQKIDYEQIGWAIQSALQFAIEFAWETLVSAWNWGTKLVEWIQDQTSDQSLEGMWDNIVTTFRGIEQALKDIFGPTWEWVLLKAWEVFLDIGDKTIPMQAKIMTAMQTIQYYGATAFNEVSKAATDVANTIVNTVITAIADLINTIADLMESAVKAYTYVSTLGQSNGEEQPAETISSESVDSESSSSASLVQGAPSTFTPASSNVSNPLKRQSDTVTALENAAFNEAAKRSSTGHYDSEGKWVSTVSLGTSRSLDEMYGDNVRIIVTKPMYGDLSNVRIQQTGQEFLSEYEREQIQTGSMEYGAPALPSLQVPDANTMIKALRDTSTELKKITVNLTALTAGTPVLPSTEAENEATLKTFYDASRDEYNKRNTKFLADQLAAQNKANVQADDLKKETERTNTILDDIKKGVAVIPPTLKPAEEAAKATEKNTEKIEQAIKSGNWIDPTNMALDDVRSAIEDMSGMFYSGFIGPTSEYPKFMAKEVQQKGWGAYREPVALGSAAMKVDGDLTPLKEKVNDFLIGANSRYAIIKVDADTSQAINAIESVVNADWGIDLPMYVPGNTDYRSYTGKWSGPRYQSGIDYVPYDQVALVHKGERIIPATQNTRSGEGFTYQDNRTISINGGNAYEVKAALAEHDREMISKIRKEVVRWAKGG